MTRVTIASDTHECRYLSSHELQQQPRMAQLGERQAGWAELGRRWWWRELSWFGCFIGGT